MTLVVSLKRLKSLLPSFTRTRNRYRGNLTKLTSPSQQAGLRVTGWERAFFDAIQHKSNLEAEVEIILQRTTLFAWEYVM